LFLLEQPDFAREVLERREREVARMRGREGSMVADGGNTVELWKL
jgi:hypothetical protein